MTNTSSQHFFKLFLLSVVFNALGACATPTPQPAVETARCTGSGIGLSIPPTTATLAAITAHNSVEALPVTELFDRLAKGDEAAMIELGVRYATGKDLPMNADRALILFETAARQGNPIGYYFFGTAYSLGFGIPKDGSRAVVFWEEAARLGYAPSQYALATMIANGMGGIERNWCAAVPLFEAAAAQNISDAAFMLGVAYHEDELGPADYERAASWYRKANKIAFNQKAQYNLRLLIEGYLIEWEEGDPGRPAPPRPINPEDAKPQESKISPENPSPNSAP